jgi:putative oxidoreductase
MFFTNYEAMLPKWLLLSTAYYTSYVELIGGALLILGLWRRPVLYLLALCLVIVSLGHGLAEPIWDLQHVFPRAVLLGALLLLPAEWDRWHADGLLRKKSN